MFRYNFADWYLSLLDFVLPPDCGGCGTPGFRWCSTCSAHSHEFSDVVCTICGDSRKNAGICQKCLQDPPSFDMARSWTSYHGPIQNAVQRMKYDTPDRALGHQLAKYLYNFLRGVEWGYDVVVPVPLGKARIKSRGYNQVDLFGKPLAQRSERKYAPCTLRRVKETKSQVNLNLRERKQNVREAFALADESVVGKNILLLDDVFTTGATMEACAAALKAGGASKVYCLSLARAMIENNKY